MGKEFLRNLSIKWGSPYFFKMGFLTSNLFFVILENFSLCLMQRALRELPVFEVMT